MRKAKSTLALVMAVMLAIAGIGIWAVLLSQRHAATDFDASPSREESSEMDGFPLVDWEYWQGVNPDIVGWVTIPGTPIDYPIVQAQENDPDYYLDHDVYLNWNMYGAIYLDACNAQEGFDSRLAYVFGHHMDDGSMFAALADLSAADAACSCKILLQTPEEKMRLDVCAVDIVNADTEMKHADFPSDAAFREWVRDSVGNADTVIAIPEDAGSIKAFVTCSYNRFSNERTIAYAR